MLTWLGKREWNLQMTGWVDEVSVGGLGFCCNGSMGCNCDVRIELLD